MKIDLSTAKIGDEFETTSGEVVRLFRRYSSGNCRMSCLNGETYIVTNTGEARFRDSYANLVAPVHKPGRARVRDAASRCTLHDRNAAYGSPEDNFAAIAALWSAYLPQAVTPQDVAILMILLKVARFKHKPSIDTIVDIAGYSFCLGDFFTPEEWNQYNP